MSTTYPKKKKVIKKKVVKKVVKKKKRTTPQGSPTRNGVMTSKPFNTTPKKKAYTNGHAKVNPIPGMRNVGQNRTHRPSIEDAITRFTSLIQEQTEIIDKLKQENQKLKKEIEELKTRPPETKVVYIRKSLGNNDGNISPRDRGTSRSPRSGPPKRALPGMNNG